MHKILIALLATLVSCTFAFAAGSDLGRWNKIFDETHDNLLKASIDSNDASTSIAFLGVYIQNIVSYANTIIEQAPNEADAGTLSKAYSNLVALESQVVSLLRSSDTSSAQKSDLRVALVLIRQAKSIIEKRWEQIGQDPGDLGKAAAKFKPLISPFIGDPHKDK